MSYIPGLSEFEYKERLAAEFNRRTEYDSGRNLDWHNRLIELANLRVGQKILDIATGTGLVAIAAAQQVAPDGVVVGVDIATGLLSQAERKIQMLGLQNVELIEADADYLDFPDKSFDVVFCNSALIYLAHIQNALCQWYRFLRPGGLVAFNCFPETFEVAGVIWREIARRHGVLMPSPNEPLSTPEKCYIMLKQAGFEQCEVIIEKSGNYYSLEAMKKYASRTFTHPLDYQMLQLAPKQLEQLKADYIAEVEKLAEEQGIWNDTTIFYVLGRKPSDES